MLYVAVAAIAYVASIYTWPWVRLKVAGAQTEIQWLEDRVKQIRAAL